MEHASPQHRRRGPSSRACAGWLQIAAVGRERQMPFLVVAGNNLGQRGPTHYRGTFRERPPHADALADDSEYNRLFQWYCDVGGESGVVEDLDRARALLVRLRHDVGRKDFELVEARRAG